VHAEVLARRIETGKQKAERKTIREKFWAAREGDELAKGEYGVSNKRMPSQEVMDAADAAVPADYDLSAIPELSRVDGMNAAIKRVGRENVVQGKDMEGNWYYRIFRW
jgi:hypothetical protein